MNWDSIGTLPNVVGTVTLCWITTYQPLFKDHGPQPFEVESFEGRENKEGVLFVAFSLLDGSLWVGDTHSGPGAHIFLIATHWGLVQPATHTGQLVLGIYKHRVLTIIGSYTICLSSIPRILSLCLLLKTYRREGTLDVLF